MGSILFLLVVAFIAKSEAKIFSKNEKEVQILSLQGCPNATNIWAFNGKIHKYNRTTQVLDANLTLLEDFTDDFSLDVEMRRWSDGGWKNNFIRMNKKNGCTAYLTVFGEGPKLALIDLGRKSTCPITKGFLQIKNLKFDTNTSPLAIIKGRHLLIIRIMKSSQAMTCLEALIEIKDKES